ncbi:MAG: polysaccharide deacetylase family protein [Thermoleophilia bacterium]
MNRRIFTGLIILALGAVAVVAGFAGRGLTAEGNGTTSAAALPEGDPAAVAGQTATLNAWPAPQPRFEPLAYPPAAPVPAREIKVPILMYHHVGEPPAGADKIRRGLTVSAADFDAQMSYLKKAGYQPISQTDLFNALFAARPLPANPVMLTFDDGYTDNYEVGLPILQKYSFPATFYIISDRVGEAEYMTWDQVVKLDQAGMDIGSHTATHPDLTEVSSAEAQKELTGSSQILQIYLGHPVYWLCYPAGKYDDTVVSLARSTGYLLAVTTEAGEVQSSGAPLTLWRYRVRDDTGLAGFEELVR